MREVKKFFFLGRIFLNLNKQDLTLHQFLCRNVFGLGSSMVKSFAARLGIPSYGFFFGASSFWSTMESKVASARKVSFCGNAGFMVSCCNVF